MEFEDGSQTSERRLNSWWQNSWCNCRRELKGSGGSSIDFFVTPEVCEASEEWFCSSSRTDHCLGDDMVSFSDL